MDYQGFGNGSDGAATLSGTDAPIDSSSSGTSGTKSLTATNASFASGKLILIHQSRGTGPGNYELNIIDSYSTGTITTVFDLVNTYTDSGASQAQVIQLKEYSSVTVTGTYTAKAWDGNVGGIIAFLCSGETNVSGTLTATGKGFRGGAGTAGQSGGNSQPSFQGEGSPGIGIQTNTANGNGGAGQTANGDAGGAGGGGGHATAGAKGEDGQGGFNSASGTVGDTIGATLFFGGGGGGGKGETNANTINTGAGGDGGPGGGIIYILTASLVVTGSIQSNGANGFDCPQPGHEEGAGGGGAGGGGAIFITCVVATYGTNLISAVGGIGGDGSGSFDSDGGDGGQGRVFIYACGKLGSGNSTTPTANEYIGGHDFCQNFIHIY